MKQFQKSFHYSLALILGCLTLFLLVSCRSESTSDSELPVTLTPVTLTVVAPAVDEPLADLLGLVGAPFISSGSRRWEDFSAEFQNVGITHFRNNDLTGILDMETMFNCTGVSDGLCESDRMLGDELPCWATCSPVSSTDPALIFTDADQAFSLIQDSGFNLFFRIGGSWSGRTTNPPNDDCDASDVVDKDGYSFKGPQGPNEEANFIQAARYIVEHFGTAFGENSLPYLDLWTEANNEHFYDVDSNSGCAPLTQTDHFYDFIGALATELKAAFPTKKVGGFGSHGEAANIARGSTEVSTYKFLTRLWESNISFDFFDMHIFEHEDPFQFYIGPLCLDAMLKAESMTATAGGINYTCDYTTAPWAGSDFFVNTEVIIGAYHNDPEYYSDPLSAKYDEDAAEARKSGLLGAALQAAYWIEMQNTGVVQKAFFYRALDPEYTTDGMGILLSCESSNCSPYKPVANALRLESRLFEGYPNKLSNPDPDGGTSGALWWVGGEVSASGDKAILIANTGSAELAFEISYLSRDGHTRTMSQYDVTVYQLNTTHDGTSVTATRAAGATDVMSLDGESVALVILQVAD